MVLLPPCETRECRIRLVIDYRTYVSELGAAGQMGASFGRAFTRGIQPPSNEKDKCVDKPQLVASNNRRHGLNGPICLCSNTFHTKMSTKAISHLSTITTTIKWEVGVNKGVMKRKSIIVVFLRNVRLQGPIVRMIGVLLKFLIKCPDWSRYLP